MRAFKASKELDKVRSLRTYRARRHLFPLSSFAYRVLNPRKEGMPW
jgi:hypothetical protein